LHKKVTQTDLPSTPNKIIIALYPQFHGLKRKKYWNKKI